MPLAQADWVCNQFSCILHFNVLNERKHFSGINKFGMRLGGALCSILFFYVLLVPHAMHSQTFLYSSSGFSHTIFTKILYFDFSDASLHKFAYFGRERLFLLVFLSYKTVAYRSQFLVCLS